MPLDMNLTNSHFPNSKSNLTGETCRDIPSFINSKGSWVKLDGDQWWFKAYLPLIEFELIMLGLTMAITHLFLKRFGISKISSQILVGLIFGCSWNQLDKPKFEVLEVGSQDVLVLMAIVGYTLFLFLSGVKIDVSMVIKNSKTAYIIGIPALLVPLIISNYVLTLYFDKLTTEELDVLLVIIPIHVMTSFPVIASLLAELKIVNSEMGRLGLSSALISDLFALFTLVTVSHAIRYKDNPPKATFEFAALILLLVLIVFVFRPAMIWIIKQTPEGVPVESCYIQCIVVMAFFTTVLSAFTGQVSILGPYLLGLAVPDGPPLASSLVAKLECLVSEVFMPILIATCALRADVSKMWDSFNDDYAKVSIILLCVGFVVKVVVCAFSSLCCKLPFSDSLALSLILSSKGPVELVLYSIARDRQAIDNGIFGLSVLYILFIATLVPMMVGVLYDPSRKYAGYQNRNIMHLNSSSDKLCMLACVHRNEDINSIIHLLNLSCPTVENPLTINIFHLIELSGRTAPIFISHKHHRHDNDYSYSQYIIHSFNQFERNNIGTVHVECFTSVSPCKFMHDAVCTLALDKITSFIILPFHRTWTVDGFIDNDDNRIRTLNCSVLERAPCSVGIFADQGNLGSNIIKATSFGMKGRSISSSTLIFSVCVIFLGGKDDREAISYARRLGRDSRVKLTVVRLVEASSEENGFSKSIKEWEDVIDNETIKDFKVKCLGDETVKYMEEVCEDGQETAFILRKLVQNFDLIIVGRRNGLESPQTAGLDEWNEFPELGVLGDLIASTDHHDMNNRASLLVIQQQII